MPVFRPIRIAEVITETPDARSLVLDAAFDYRPGQYLTIRTPAGARCYSLSSSPFSGERPTVTVKRVRGGQVSNWICDHVRPGDTLEFSEPAGSFTPGSLDDDLLLLASDGLTGMMEDEDLQALLEEGGSLEDQVDRLIAEANRRGGLDNITVILVSIAEVSPPTGEQPAVS